MVQPMDLIRKAERESNKSSSSIYNEISFHSGAIFSMRPVIRSKKPAVGASHMNSKMSLSSNGRRSKREQDFEVMS